MKSHTPFRLVPKSTTLDDLEWPICTLLQKKMRLSEATTKIWMKIDPYYRQRKCRPMTLVSGNIRSMRIFAVLLSPLLPFHWPPKYMTLSDFDWLFRAKFCFCAGLAGWHCTNSESNCVKTNTDRHILSAVEISGMDSSFWRYKVCADIRLGSLERRRYTTVGSRVNARFEHIFLVFENCCVQVNTDRPILQQPPCSSGILVSGSIKIMRVFTGVPEKRDLKRQWGRASCARL